MRNTTQHFDHSGNWMTKEAWVEKTLGMSLLGVGPHINIYTHWTTTRQLEVLKQKALCKTLNNVL